MDQSRGKVESIWAIQISCLQCKWSDSFPCRHKTKLTCLLWSTGRAEALFGYASGHVGGSSCSGGSAWWVWFTICSRMVSDWNSLVLLKTISVCQDATDMKLRISMCFSLEGWRVFPRAKHYQGLIQDILPHITSHQSHIQWNNPCSSNSYLKRTNPEVWWMSWVCCFMRRVPRWKIGVTSFQGVWASTPPATTSQHNLWSGDCGFGIGYRQRCTQFGGWMYMGRKIGVNIIWGYPLWMHPPHEITTMLEGGGGRSFSSIVVRCCSSQHSIFNHIFDTSFLIPSVLKKACGLLSKELAQSDPLLWYQ